MRAPIATLKAEADALAAHLPGFTAHIGAASASHLGGAGRRRAGAGEHFWQYRNYMREDGAERIDWRRSARGDRLFVRETELETARTFLFWCDPSNGFHWRSADHLPTKAERAIVLEMALASILAKSGERCGALGGARPAAMGARAAIRVGEDLWSFPPDAVFPASNRDAATVILASDFYASMDTWRARLHALSARNRTGIILAICDPVEEDYPFEGRMRLSAPGEETSRLLGRAENVRDAYIARFHARRQEVQTLAAEIGWGFVVHRTDQAPAIALSATARFLSNAGISASGAVS